MIGRDFLSAEELCNENAVVMVDTSDINEESAPVSAGANLGLGRLGSCLGR